MHHRQLLCRCGAALVCPSGVLRRKYEKKQSTSSRVRSSREEMNMSLGSSSGLSCHSAWHGPPRDGADMFWLTPCETST